MCPSSLFGYTFIFIFLISCQVVNLVNLRLFIFLSTFPAFFKTKFHVFELSSSPEGFLGQVGFPPFLDAIAVHSSFRSPFSPPRLRRSFKKNRSAPAKPAATAAATPFLSC